MPDALHQLAPDLWMAGYPLKMMGANLRRNVTIIRLSSGQLVIHSSGPFSSGDVAAISALGQPRWLLDTLLRHDTFTREGRAAFPAASYLAPTGFPHDSLPLVPAPAEWGSELQLLPVDGAPDMGEHVVFHPASRTLIVADLLVNFGPHENLWTKFLLSLATVDGHYAPGMTRPFQKAIKDSTAFSSSVEKILAWDFDRIIVGHGDVIPTNGRTLLTVAIRDAGFDLA